MTHKEFLKYWKVRHPDPASILDEGTSWLYAAKGSPYVRVTCPYCESNGKGPDQNHHCHTHYEQEWFKCQRCGASGTLDYLLRIKNRKKPKEKSWDNYSSTPQTRKVDPTLAARSKGLESSKVKPGACVWLNDLPKTHPAWQYLVSEGFGEKEIEQLSEFHGIYYCVHGKQVTSNAKNTTTGRLIFEIREGNTVYGWQARWLPKSWPPSPEDIEESKEVEKYLFSPGFKRSFLLYNWDLAQNWDMWVLVEGIKKVWKTGPFALATFGISTGATPPEETPEEALKKFWSVRLQRGQRPVAILYDRDGLSAARVHEEKLREMGVDAKAIELPQGGPNDLDNYSQVEILQIIKNAMGRLPQKLQ